MDLIKAMALAKNLQNCECRINIYAKVKKQIVYMFDENDNSKILINDNNKKYYLFADKLLKQIKRAEFDLYATAIQYCLYGNKEKVI